MKTVKEIRLENLKLLIKEIGTATKLAELSGTSESYLSQLLKKRKSDSGKERGVGDSLAKKLEQGAKKQPGWMDQDHSAGRVPTIRWSGEVSSGDAKDHIRIPVYDVEVSAGNGIFADQVEVVTEYFNVNAEWFAETTGMKPHDSLLIARVIGDSMKKTLSPGDLFILDYRDTRLADGIFCIRFDNTVMLKRLSPNPGGIVDVISDNRDKYDPKQWRVDQFEIVGRVVLCWHGEKF